MGGRNDFLSKEQPTEDTAGDDEPNWGGRPFAIFSEGEKGDEKNCNENEDTENEMAAERGLTERFDRHQRDRGGGDQTDHKQTHHPENGIDITVVAIGAKQFQH